MRNTQKLIQSALKSISEDKENILDDPNKIISINTSFPSENKKDEWCSTLESMIDPEEFSFEKIKVLEHLSKEKHANENRKNLIAHS